MRKTLSAAALASLVNGCGGVKGRNEAVAATEAPIPTPTIASTDPGPLSSADIDLRAYPVMPTLSGRAREIFRQGRARGRDPHVFSKVGDCMTASPDFPVPFSTGAYDLGDYGYLQAVVDHYTVVAVREMDGRQLDSFSNPSLAPGRVGL